MGFEAALDPIARRKGLVARAGASSTPALSTAVVEDITRRWQRLDSVDIAIMPGGAGQVGAAVIRAILGYAGTTIATFEEGAPAEVTGWGSVKRVRVPGLGVRYLSPVETADAALLPERFGVTSRVTFYAGLESRLEQFGLLFLAKLRRRGLVGNLEPLAPLLESARRVTGLFASDRGGMTVDCAGLDADRPPNMVAVVSHRRKRRRPERAGAAGRGSDAGAARRRRRAGSGSRDRRTSARRDRGRDARARLQNLTRRNSCRQPQPVRSGLR